MVTSSVLNIYLYLAPPDAIFIYIVYLDMEHLPPWLGSHGCHENLSTNICISMGGGGERNRRKKVEKALFQYFVFKFMYCMAYPNEGRRFVEPRKKTSVGLLVFKIELFTEDQAFLPPQVGSSPNPPPSRHIGRLTKRDRLLGERGWGRSQIIRRWESLILHKSFNTLWSRCQDMRKHCNWKNKCFSVYAA
jgi:hypothetical protein